MHFDRIILINSNIKGTDLVLSGYNMSLHGSKLFGTLSILFEKETNFRSEVIDGRVQYTNEVSFGIVFDERVDTITINKDGFTIGKEMKRLDVVDFTKMKRFLIGTSARIKIQKSYTIEAFEDIPFDKIAFFALIPAASFYFSYDWINYVEKPSHTLENKFKIFYLAKVIDDRDTYPTVFYIKELENNVPFETINLKSKYVVQNSKLCLRRTTDIKTDCDDNFVMETYLEALNAAIINNASVVYTYGYEKEFLQVTNATLKYNMKLVAIGQTQKVNLSYYSGIKYSLIGNISLDNFEVMYQEYPGKYYKLHLSNSYLFPASALTESNNILQFVVYDDDLSYFSNVTISKDIYLYFSNLKAFDKYFSSFFLQENAIVTVNRLFRVEFSDKYLLLSQKYDEKVYVYTLKELPKGCLIQFNVHDCEFLKDYKLEFVANDLLKTISFYGEYDSNSFIFNYDFAGTRFQDNNKINISGKGTIRYCCINSIDDVPFVAGKDIVVEKETNYYEDLTFCLTSDLQNKNIFCSEDQTVTSVSELVKKLNIKKSYDNQYRVYVFGFNEDPLVLNNGKYNITFVPGEPIRQKVQVDCSQFDYLNFVSFDISFNQRISNNNAKEIMLYHCSFIETYGVIVTTTTSKFDIYDTELIWDQVLDITLQEDQITNLVNGLSSESTKVAYVANTFITIGKDCIYSGPMTKLIDFPIDQSLIILFKSDIYIHKHFSLNEGESHLLDKIKFQSINGIHKIIVGADWFDYTQTGQGIMRLDVGNLEVSNLLHSYNIPFSSSYKSFDDEYICATKSSSSNFCDLSHTKQGDTLKSETNNNPSYYKFIILEGFESSPLKISYDAVGKFNHYYFLSSTQEKQQIELTATESAAYMAFENCEILLPKYTKELSNFEMYKSSIECSSSSKYDKVSFKGLSYWQEADIKLFANIAPSVISMNGRQNNKIYKTATVEIPAGLSTMYFTANMITITCSSTFSLTEYELIDNSNIILEINDEGRLISMKSDISNLSIINMVNILVTENTSSPINEGRTTFIFDRCWTMCPIIGWLRLDSIPMRKFPIVFDYYETNDNIAVPDYWTENLVSTNNIIFMNSDYYDTRYISTVYFSDIDLLGRYVSLQDYSYHIFIGGYTDNESVLLDYASYKFDRCIFYSAKMEKQKVIITFQNDDLTEFFHLGLNGLDININNTKWTHFQTCDIHGCQFSLISDINIESSNQLLIVHNFQGMILQENIIMNYSKWIFFNGFPEMVLSANIIGENGYIGFQTYFQRIYIGNNEIEPLYEVYSDSYDIPDTINFDISKHKGKLLFICEKNLLKLELKYSISNDRAILSHLAFSGPNIDFGESWQENYHIEDNNEQKIEILNYYSGSKTTVTYPSYLNIDSLAIFDKSIIKQMRESEMICLSPNENVEISQNCRYIYHNVNDFIDNHILNSHSFSVFCYGFDQKTSLHFDVNEYVTPKQEFIFQPGKNQKTQFIDFIQGSHYRFNSMNIRASESIYNDCEFYDCFIDYWRNPDLEQFYNCIFGENCQMYPSTIENKFNINNNTILGNITIELSELITFYHDKIYFDIWCSRFISCDFKCKLIFDYSGHSRVIIMRDDSFGENDLNNQKITLACKNYGSSYINFSFDEWLGYDFSAHKLNFLLNNAQTRIIKTYTTRTDPWKIDNASTNYGIWNLHEGWNIYFFNESSQSINTYDYSELMISIKYIENAIWTDRPVNLYLHYAGTFDSELIVGYPNVTIQSSYTIFINLAQNISLVLNTTIDAFNGSGRYNFESFKIYWNFVSVNRYSHCEDQITLDIGDRPLLLSNAVSFYDINMAIEGEDNLRHVIQQNTTFNQAFLEYTMKKIPSSITFKQNSIVLSGYSKILDDSSESLEIPLKLFPYSTSSANLVIPANANIQFIKDETVETNSDFRWCKFELVDPESTVLKFGDEWNGYENSPIQIVVNCSKDYKLNIEGNKNLIDAHCKPDDVTGKPEGTFKPGALKNSGNTGMIVGVTVGCIVVVAVVVGVLVFFFVIKKPKENSSSLSESEINETKNTTNEKIASSSESSSDV